MVFIIFQQFETPKTPISQVEKLQLQSNKLNNLENIDKNNEFAETSSLFMVKFNYYPPIGTIAYYKASPHFVVNYFFFLQ